MFPHCSCRQGYRTAAVGFRRPTELPERPRTAPGTHSGPVLELRVAAGEISGLDERMNVFEKTPPHCLYLLNGTEWEAKAETVCVMAVCSAPGQGGHEARRIGPDGSALTERGKVTNTHHPQAQNFCLLTASGDAITLHMSSSEKFWLALSRAMERTDLAEDPRFTGHYERTDN